MEEPTWVSEELVIAIHERQLAEHGGSAGIRDEGMLDSALARPRQKWANGEGVELPPLATAYAFGLAKNDPFVDGNKRTAAVVSELFMELNGFVLVASDMDSYPVCMAVAGGEMGEEELARWLSDNAHPAQVNETRGGYG